MSEIEQILSDLKKGLPLLAQQHRFLFKRMTELQVGAEWFEVGQMAKVEADIPAHNRAKYFRALAEAGMDVSVDNIATRILEADDHEVAAVNALLDKAFESVGSASPTLRAAVYISVFDEVQPTKTQAEPK